MKKRIKSNPDGNKYILTNENMWVRKFTAEGISFVDINKTIKQSDHFVFLENEVKNNLQKHTWIDSENYDMRKVLIVSDGYDFSNKHKILANIPKDVTIIGVNGSLNKWSIPNRSLNWYLSNNPYEECLHYLPRRNKILPKCIISPRTNHKFVSSYNLYFELDFPILIEFSVFSFSFIKFIFKSLFHPELLSFLSAIILFLSNI